MKGSGAGNVLKKVEIENVKFVCEVRRVSKVLFIYVGKGK